MQQQYFSVQHALNLNVEAVKPQALPLDQQQFEAEIPEPFRLSGENTTEELASLRGLKPLGEAGELLLAYLERQANKLNRVLSYVLSHHDNAEQRCQSISFGGSELSFAWNSPLEVGQALRVKIFVPEENAAIYCYGEVERVQARPSQSLDESEASSQIHVSYRWIREQDIELLVRASLHIQTQQLKDRANARQQSQQNDQ